MEARRAVVGIGVVEDDDAEVEVEVEVEGGETWPLDAAPVPLPFEEVLLFRAGEGVGSCCTRGVFKAGFDEWLMKSRKGTRVWFIRSVDPGRPRGIEMDRVLTEGISACVTIGIIGLYQSGMRAENVYHLKPHDTNLNELNHVRQQFVASDKGDGRRDRTHR